MNLQKLPEMKFALFNAQLKRHYTPLQIDWHNFILASKWWSARSGAISEVHRIK
jgi:hypothetical protein